MKPLKIIFIAIAVLMFLATLLQFDFVATPVAKAVGKPVEAIKSLGKTILFVGVGLLIVYLGVLALPATLIAGVALIGVGGFLLYQAIWPLLSTPKKPG